MSFKRYATGYCKLHDADRTIPITYAFIRKKTPNSSEYLRDRNACLDAVNCDYFDRCEIYNNLDPVITV